MSDEQDPEIGNDALFEVPADRVYQQLLERVGEVTTPAAARADTPRGRAAGDPQRSYPIIHITGTNGKTSTSRIAESILRAYGLRTGLLTSPHLVRMNERIVIDGESISDEALVATGKTSSPTWRWSTPNCWLPTTCRSPSSRR